MINTRRELLRINRQMAKYHRAVGEGVLWYEYAAEDYIPGDYLHGGGRSYKAGIVIPVLWISEYEDDEAAAAEGRRYTPTLRFAANVQMTREAGLSDVEDARRHLNDIVLYSRTLWNVGSYQVRGRVRNESTIIGVNAIKIFPDEDMAFDNLPPGILPDYTRRPEPVINNEDDATDNWLDFPDHGNPKWGV